MPKRRAPRTAAPPPSRPKPADEPAEALFGDAEDDFARIGETLRRLALGLIAAVVVARPMFPGEEADAGTGLSSVLLVLLAAACAVAGQWLSAHATVRRSWADASFLALVALVVLSVSNAADRRPAINLAWEWIGVGVAYVLVRALPRTRAESHALVGVLIAAAVAVAAYGLYQAQYELEALRVAYLKDPDAIMRLAGLDPSHAVTRKLFEGRLLHSREIYATFALANSLAGFLVGPLVVLLGIVLDRLIDRRAGGERSLIPLALALPSLAVLLICLVGTKSRSAWLGLLVGLAVVAFRRRRALPPRLFWGTVIAGCAGLALLVAGAAATGKLDRRVLTESTKSFRYRAEYWQGTWGLITESRRNLTGGVGPGNFGGRYLRHKPAVSSEEIADPHNLVFDVWASSGLFAACALVAALVLAFRETVAPPRGESVAEEPVPRRPWRAWLWGSGGLVLIVVLDRLDPFSDDGLARWLVLTAGWSVAALTLAPLWRTTAIRADLLGAGGLAVAVNLLAAGGIGIPPVALALWLLLAVGQNLRDDRPCGRPVVLSGRWAAFGLAAVVSALLGAFLGAILPFWRSEAALADAREAVARRPPDFDAARAAYRLAAATDRFSPRPWLGLADLEYRDWLATGANPALPVWRHIASSLDQATTPPRDPASLGVLRMRIDILRDLIARGAGGPIPGGVVQLRRALINATARAVEIYPTSAALRAELAEACAAGERYPEAARAARIALDLDRITPHEDKKLAPAVRERLTKSLPEWTRRAEAAKPNAPRRAP